MSLPVLRKRLDNLWIRLVPIGLKAVQNHSQPAVRHYCPFKRCIGLKTHDYLVVAVNVSGLMRKYSAWDLGYIEHSFAALLKEQRIQPIPDLLSSFGRTSEERGIPLIRFVILLYEVTYIDFVLPESGSESFPSRTQFFAGSPSRTWRNHLIAPHMNIFHKS